MDKNTALLVIDVQKGFDEPQLGTRNNLDAESNIIELIAHWRKAKMPIIFIQHASKNINSPFYPNKPGFSLKDGILPTAKDCLIQKNENSAFIGTNLENHLRTSAIKDLVVVGLTTDHCVSTTIRMGANLGFNMTVLSDATATFGRTNHKGQYFTAEDVHEIHLASLHEEFARVVGMGEVF